MPHVQIFNIYNIQGLETKLMSLIFGLKNNFHLTNQVTFKTILFSYRFQHHKISYLNLVSYP